jgi:hypothetical protein
VTNVLSLFVILSACVGPRSSVHIQSGYFSALRAEEACSPEMLQDVTAQKSHLQLESLPFQSDVVIVLRAMSS